MAKKKSNKFIAGSGEFQVVKSSQAKPTKKARPKGKSKGK